MSNAPNLTNDHYPVALRLLRDPQAGLLLVPTPAQIASKWADARDSVAIANAGATEEDRKRDDAINAAAEKMELELYAEVESSRQDDLKTYTFTFRVPTIEDHEAAEFAANKGDKRSEIAYRRELAQRTFVATDYPDYRDMGNLPAGVAVHVFREVASRVTLSTDVRSFIKRPAPASDAATAFPPN